MNLGPCSTRADHKVMAALLCGNLLYYGTLTRRYPFVSSDGFIYLALAKNILTQGFVIEGSPHEKFLPLYPLLMGLGEWVSAHHWPVETWGHIISIVSGALVPPLLYRLMRGLGASRFAATLMAAFQSLTMIGVTQYADVNVMPLFNLLMVLTFFLVWRKKFFWLGMAAGLAAITRFEVYLLLPFLVWSNRKPPRRLLAAGIGFIICAGPWYLRNLFLYGDPLKTKYVGELFMPAFNLIPMFGDALREAGPLLMAAALLGFRRLDREWKLQLGGFGLLYVLLHLFWWRYNHRFLLPLVPVVLVPASLGTDRIIAYINRRRPGRSRLVSIAWAIAILGQVLAVSALAFRIAASQPYDPIGEAARLVRVHFPREPVLTSYEYELKYYLDQKVYSLQVLPPGKDPHKFIANEYYHHGVRLVVWSSAHPQDWNRFDFLREGRDFSAKVPTPAGNVRLVYMFFKKVGDLPRQIIIYELVVFPEK